MRSLQSGLRTVDVARRAGCSVQHVRDLEAAGVLRPAGRTASGYRTFAEEHVRAAQAHRALAAAVGPVHATELLRTAHRDPPGLLRLLDAAHARLDAERRDLALAREAAELIAGEPIRDVRPSDAMGVAELAAALGVRPSTLRHWDAEGLVSPRRGAGEARRYSPADVRDARIVHQLRRAGYRIGPLRELVPRFREAGRHDDVRAALAARDADVDARSRALFEGTAALAALLGAGVGGGDRGAGGRS
ncbi:MerR family transcriptional regulator [Geodermatophilus sp. SYSU D00867]